MEATPTTTPDVLKRAAARWGDRPAIVDGQWGRQVTLTWTELHDEVRRFAAALIAHGVEAGDRVAIWAPNSYHWPIAALGVHYAGATLVPLNSRYTLSESRDIIERSAAKVVIASGSFLKSDNAAQLAEAPIGDLIIRIPLTDESPAETPAETQADTSSASSSPAVLDWTAFLATGTDLDAADARAAAVTGADLSDILFTSGTTGKPKGVLAEHRQTVAGAHAWAANGRLTESDRYLMANPFFHTFGYKAGILAATLFGVTMYPLAVYSPVEAMKLVDGHGITVFPGAPTIFATILDAPERADYDLSSLRLIVTGATIVPVVLVERLQSDLGVETVVTAYGQTETSGFITTCTPADDDETVANTCGRAFEGMEVELSDQGEVLARGAMVMRGYLDDPEATAKTIDPDGWLHTGDIGRFDDNGNLMITDRLKDMYICGGFNVYPAEVEQALSRIDGVTEVAVIGVPDDRLGEVGRAYLTVAAGADVTQADVIAFAKERLANFKVPREVLVIDQMPRNASGKIVKRELPTG